MYEELGWQNIQINVHAYDRSITSVNKSIDNQANVQNCNEQWHAAKSVM